MSDKPKLKRLKLARVKADMSQSQLAAAMGGYWVSKISQWERGFATPTLADALKLAQVLSTPVEALFPELAPPVAPEA